MNPKKTMQQLEPWRDLIEEMTPFGEAPEEVIEDTTLVATNAPRAIMAQGFQSKINLLVDLKERGYLREHPDQPLSIEDLEAWADGVISALRADDLKGKVSQEEEKIAKFIMCVINGN